MASVAGLSTGGEKLVQPLAVLGQQLKFLIHFLQSIIHALVSKTSLRALNLAMQQSREPC